MISLAVAATLAASSPTPVSDILTEQALTIERMNALYPEVHVSVAWIPCGTVNSYYFPDIQKIVLCTEVADQDPDAAVFIAAHEMGHAITHQITDTTNEQDADEVAALSLIRLGQLDDLLAGAMFFRTEVEQKHTKGDPHPGGGYRAWELMCIEDGAESDGSPECKYLYNGLRIRWGTRLANP